MIYTSPSCVFCRRLKEVLAKNNFDYIEYNVSVDKERAMEMLGKSGEVQIPVIETNDKILIDFDQEKLSYMLGLIPLSKIPKTSLFFDPAMLK